MDAIEEGKCYYLKDFHVKEYQLRKHLSMPKSDFEITPIDDIKNTVTPLPDDDEYTTVRVVRVIGVIQLDSYKCCLQCKARVEPQTPPMGKCTKDSCMMMQLFELCQDQITARVLLQHRYDEGQYDNVMCSAFGDIVYQLANIPKNHPITKADLLKTQPIREVRFHTSKKIILSIVRRTACYRYRKLSAKCFL